MKIHFFFILVYNCFWKLSLWSFIALSDMTCISSVVIQIHTNDDFIKNFLNITNMREDVILANCNYRFGFTFRVFSFCSLLKIDVTRESKFTQPKWKPQLIYCVQYETKHCKGFDSLCKVDAIPISIRKWTY